MLMMAIVNDCIYAAEVDAADSSNIRTYTARRLSGAAGVDIPPWSLQIAKDAEELFTFASGADLNLMILSKEAHL